MSKLFSENLIAPCGMNCKICSGYLREKNKCPGCNGDDKYKTKVCAKCKIKNCESLRDCNVKFCFACEKFPCDKIEHLDKRYRGKYHMSMIENLLSIKKIGITKFLDNQEEKWKCSRCGGAVCCHNGLCYHCDMEKIKNRKYKYRWNE